MKLLSLDPSSTCTGWAVFEDGTLVEAGAWKPSEKECPEAMDRIYIMASYVSEEIIDSRPDEIVIEIPAAHKPGKMIHTAANIGVYAMAVGAVLQAVWEECGFENVYPIDAELWTARVSKKQRRGWLLLECPMYKEQYAKGDSGCDIADAIELGLWFLNNRTVLNAKAENNADTR